MRVAILDRENGNMKQMLALLKGRHFERQMMSFTSTFALVSYIYDECRGDVDLLYIYVSGKEDRNILAAQDIQSFFPHIRIIFFSEDSDCAENIFMAFPSYFLKLPIKEEKLKASIERVENEFEEELCQTITLVAKGQTHKVRFASINYIESEGRKLDIYTADNFYEINMTIAEMLDKLPPNFIQPHRSYIVNANKIMQFKGDLLELSGGEQIPVARPRQKEIREFMNKDKGER